MMSEPKQCIHYWFTVMHSDYHGVGTDSCLIEETLSINVAPLETIPLPIIVLMYVYSWRS